MLSLLVLYLLIVLRCSRITVCEFHKKKKIEIFLNFLLIKPLSDIFFLNIYRITDLLSVHNAIIV